MSRGAHRAGRRHGPATTTLEPHEPSAGRRPGGRQEGRAARLARERRRRRRRRGLLVLAGLALCAGAVLGLLQLLGRPSPVDEAATSDMPLVEARPQQETLLLVRHGSGGGPAEGVTLLAVGPGDAEAVVLFVPAGTLVPIPGIGLDRLGLAHQYGGPTLVQSAVENALGIRIDQVAGVSPSGLSAWLGRTGGLEIDVPERLVQRRSDGTATVRFEPGRQFLDGPRLAELWGFRERDEDELVTFTRQQLVLDSLLTELTADTAMLDRLVGDGVPQLDTTASAESLRDLFGGLAAAHAEGRLTFDLLQVEPFGGEGPDGGATYRLREEAARQVRSRFFAASVPDDAGEQAVRVQILNGVGVPGIGQQVERLLGGGAFRIVRSDNAANFDFPRTRIIVYDESAASRGNAERVQERLGVGTIQVSRQPQSVTDLTIVVGADFVERHGVGEQPADTATPTPIATSDS